MKKMRTVKVNSKNVVIISQQIKEIKKNNLGHKGCFFQLSEMGNSSNILVRMSSGKGFYNPFMELKFSPHNYKFRNIILNL